MSGAPTGSSVRPPGSRFGPFQILSELGRGGVGVVYLAKHPVEGLLALKVLSSRAISRPGRALERFEREARVLRDLAHPGIVRVIAAGRVGAEPFYAMEYVAGRPLSKIVAPGGVAVGRAARIASQIAGALGFAHGRGILHRDVKPANVLLASEGEGELEQARLVDFGLARDLSEPRQTMTGQFLGTPGFVSPEQIAGEWRTIDARADIYALGVVLFQLLTGHLPFGGATMADIVRQVMTQDPPPPGRFREGVSPSLDDLCVRMMARERDARPASATMVAEELDRILSSRA